MKQEKLILLFLLCLLRCKPCIIIRAVGTPNLLPITFYLLLPKNPVSSFI